MMHLFASICYRLQEAVVLVRRAALILITAFSAGGDAYYQLGLGALVMVFALVGHLAVKPFAKPLYNHLETAAILAVIVTLLVNLLFLRAEAIATMAAQGDTPAEKVGWSIVGGSWFLTDLSTSLLLLLVNGACMVALGVTFLRLRWAEFKRDSAGVVTLLRGAIRRPSSASAFELRSAFGAFTADDEGDVEVPAGGSRTGFTGKLRGKSGQRPSTVAAGINEAQQAVLRERLTRALDGYSTPGGKNQVKVVQAARSAKQLRAPSGRQADAKAGAASLPVAATSSAGSEGDTASRSTPATTASTSRESVPSLLYRATARNAQLSRRSLFSSLDGIGPAKTSSAPVPVAAADRSRDGNAAASDVAASAEAVGGAGAASKASDTSGTATVRSGRTSVSVAGGASAAAAVAVLLARNRRAFRASAVSATSDGDLGGDDGNGGSSDGLRFASFPTPMSAKAAAKALSRNDDDDRGTGAFRTSSASALSGSSGVADADGSVLDVSNPLHRASSASLSATTGSSSASGAAGSASGGAARSSSTAGSGSSTQSTAATIAAASSLLGAAQPVSVRRARQVRSVRGVDQVAATASTAAAESEPEST